MLHLRSLHVRRSSHSTKGGHIQCMDSSRAQMCECGGHIEECVDVNFRHKPLVTVTVRNARQKNVDVHRIGVAAVCCMKTCYDQY